jgi:hypothetical protein
VSNLKILDDLEIWLRSKRTHFEELNYHTEVIRSSTEGAEVIRFDLDANSKIARITAWESGECQMEIIDVSSEDTTLSKYVDLSKYNDFDEAFNEFMKKLI